MRQNIFPTHFPWIHSRNEAKYGPLSLVFQVRQVCLIRKPFNIRQCLFSARHCPRAGLKRWRTDGGCVQLTVDNSNPHWLEPRANSNQNRFLLDFRHTFTVILPSLTRTLDNSKLPLTRSNFCFPSDHFHIILSSITRTMFWALKKSGKNSVLPPQHWILNFPLTCCRHLVY